MLHLHFFLLLHIRIAVCLICGKECTVSGQNPNLFFLLIYTIFTCFCYIINSIRYLKIGNVSVYMRWYRIGLQVRLSPTYFPLILYTLFHFFSCCLSRATGSSKSSLVFSLPLHSLSPCFIVSILRNINTRKHYL